MKTEFSEFMDWMITQNDRTMVSSVIIRLWKEFQKEKQTKKMNEN